MSRSSGFEAHILQMLLHLIRKDSDTEAMKVLLGGYLAKPLVVPLAKMISNEAGVEFETLGSWLAESDGISCDFPTNSEKPFAFSIRRGSGNTPKRGAVGLGAPGFTHPSPLRLVAAHAKSLAYDMAYYLDAILARKRYLELFSRFDLIHLHSVLPSITGARFEMLDVKKPIVLTLWGSDVLRGSVERIKRQERLLNRATLITCSTPEFKEVVLAKYGRHLEAKIRETYFSIDNDFVRQITAAKKTDARRQLAEQYNIPDQALIVCVGHNASPANQQIEALRSLGARAAELDRPLFIVVPMTYCQTDVSHIGRVREELAAQRLPGVVLTDFLDDESLCILRKATDILVYTAISDVFSATISQGLIAGQVVITGGWLPNRARKRAGSVFWEVEDVTQVGEKLVEICSMGWDAVQELIKTNEEAGLKFFSSERLGASWYEVYREATHFVEDSE